MLIRRNEGAKGSIVFVHPAGSAKEIWKDDVEYFSQWYTTMAMDLPGRGETGGEGLTDVFEYAKFVKGVMDEVKISNSANVIMVGASMGGAVAQAVALDYPEVVCGLVLLGTGAKLPCAPMIFEGIMSDYEKYLEMSGQVAYGPNTDKKIIERHRDISAKVRPEVAHGDFTSCNTFDSRDRLHEIKVPTLIMCGEVDYLMPLKFSAYLEENIENSRLITFAGVGHNVMAEVQDEFRKYMVEFLKEVYLVL
jgi:pimeloyl-ACP methyl ester carboxylesterase